MLRLRLLKRLLLLWGCWHLRGIACQQHCSQVFVGYFASKVAALKEELDLLPQESTVKASVRIGERVVKFELASVIRELLSLLSKKI